MIPGDTTGYKVSLDRFKTVDIIGIIVHCVTPRELPYKTQSVTPKRKAVGSNPAEDAKNRQGSQ